MLGFLITMLVAHSIKILVSLIFLIDDKYPRTLEYNQTSDFLNFLYGLGFGAWAIYLIVVI